MGESKGTEGISMDDKGRKLLERIYKEIDDTIEYHIESILDEDNENR